MSGNSDDTLKALASALKSSSGQDLDAGVKLLSYTGLTEGVKSDVLVMAELASTTAEANEALNNFATKGTLISTVFSGLKKKLSGITTTLSGMRTVLSAHPFIAAATAIAAVTAAVIAYVKASSDAAAQKATEAAVEGAEKYADAKESLESYTSQIKNYRDVLESSSSTEDQVYEAKTNLLTIQESLIDTYGSEAEGLDLVNGKLDDQIEKINSLSEADANAYLNRNREGIDIATKYMEDTYDGQIGTTFGDNTALAEAIKNLIADKYADYIKVNSNGDLLNLTYSIEGASKADEVLNDFATDIRKLQSEFEDSSILEIISDSLGQELDELDGILEGYQKQYDEALDARLLTDNQNYGTSSTGVKSASEWIKEYQTVVNEYNDAVSSGNYYDFVKAQDKLNAFRENLNDVFEWSPGLNQYKAYFDEITDSIDTSAEKAYEFGAVIQGKDLGNNEKQLLNNLARQIKESGLTESDFIEDAYNGTSTAINGIVREAVNADVIADTTVESLMQLAELLADWGVLTAPEATTEEDPLASLLEQLSEDDGELNTYIDNFQTKASELSEAYSNIKLDNFTSADRIDLLQKYPELLNYDSLEEGIEQELMTSTSDTLYYIAEQARELEKNGEDASAWRELYDYVLSSRNEALQDANTTITEIERSISDLQTESDKASESLSFKESLGKAITEDDYQKQFDINRKLISEYTKEISELKTLQSQATTTDQYREYQESIDAAESSIVSLREANVELAESMDALPVDRLSNEIEDLQTEADLIQEQITLEEEKGKMIDEADYSKLIKNSQQQVKYLEEQNSLYEDQLVGLDEASDKYREIHSNIESNNEAIREAIANQEEWNEKVGINSRAYFDAYEAATGTTNQGSNYDTMQSALEDMQEAYSNGLIGTDDFKTFISYLTPYGTTDSKSTEKAMELAERYLTEDATGLNNFINDMVSAGLGTITNGIFEHTFTDIEAAAKQMDIGEDFFLDMWDKSKEYGGYADFFSNTEDGLDVLDDLYGELADKTKQYYDVLNNGGDSDTLNALASEIDSLNERTKQATESLNGLYSAGDAEDTVNTAYASIGALYNEYINTLNNSDLTDQARKDISNNLATQIEEEASSASIELPINWRTEGLGADLQAEVSKYDYSGIVGQSIVDGIKAAGGTDAFQSAFATQLETLSQYSLEDLLSIDLNDGKYTEGLESAEQAIDAIQTGLGTSYTNASSLLQVLTSLGLIQIDGIDPLDIDAETANEEIATALEVAQNYANENPVEIAVTQKTAGDVIKSIGPASIDDNSSAEYITIDVTADTSAYETAVEEVEEAVSSEPTVIPVNANTSSFTSTIARVRSHESTTSTFIPLEANEKKLTDSIDEALDSKTFEITVQAKVNTSAVTAKTSSDTTEISSSISPVKRANGTPFVKSHRFNDGVVGKIGVAHANGTVGESKDTTALTGELGQELVVRGNHFFTVGDNGAEFVNLKKNDIVFNHVQTQELLSKGYTHGRGKALAQGNARDLGTGGIPIANGVGKAVVTAATSASDAVSSAASSVASDSSSTAAETSSALEDFKNWISTVVDWIQVKLDYLANRTEKYLSTAERRVASGKYDSAAEYYTKALESTNDQIVANQQGMSRYNQHAEYVMSKAIAKGLVDTATAEDIKAKVATGVIDINEYDENTREVISEYQTWYEKLSACNDSVFELFDQYLEYATSLYNLPIDDATAKTEQLSNALTILDKKLSNIVSADYNKKYGSQMTKLLKSEMDNIQRTYTANREASDQATNNLVESTESLKSVLSGDVFNAISGDISSGQKIDYTNIAGLSNEAIEAIINYNAALDAQKEASQTAAESQQDTITSLREYAEQLASVPWDVAEASIVKLTNAMSLLSEKLETATKSSTKANILRAEIWNVRRQDTANSEALAETESKRNKSAKSALRSQKKAISSSSAYTVGSDGLLKATSNATAEDKALIKAYNANKKKSASGKSMSTDGFAVDSEAYKRITQYNAYVEKYDDKLTEFNLSHQEFINSLVSYYQQLRNLPIDDCTEKVNELSDAMTLLSKQMEVTTNTTRKARIYEQEIDNTQQSYAAKKQAARTTQSRFNSISKKMDSTNDSALRGLDKNTKKAIVSAVNSGESIDIEAIQKKAKANNSTLSSNQLKLLANYNAALSAAQSAAQTASEAKYDAMKDIQEFAEGLANLPTERMEEKLEDIDNAQELLEAKYDIANSASEQNKNLTNQNAEAKKSNEAYKVRKTEAAQYVKTTASALKSLGVSFTSGKKVSTDGVAVDSEKYKAIVKYNKALEAQKTANQEAATSAAKYTKTIQQNTKRMFDNISAEYDSSQSILDAKISRLEAGSDYLSAVGYSDTSEQQTDVTKNELAVYKRLAASKWAEAEALQKQYDETYKSMSAEDRRAAQAEIIQVRTEAKQADTNIENLQNNLDNLNLSRLEATLDKLDAIQEAIEAEVKLKQAEGKDLSENDYVKQIESNTEKINNLIEQRTEVLSKYHQAVKNGGAIDGKSAAEWKIQWKELDAQINNIKADNESLKDSLRDDVYWRTFERAHDAVTRLRDNITGLNDLINDEMKWDSNGNITDLGYASLALLIQEFEKARDEVKNYTNDIDNLEKLYKTGWYTEEEYKKKLAELQQSLLDSASDMKSLQTQVIEFYKETGQAQLDALFEIIDARKENLDAQKEAYDWYKTTKASNKEVQDLDAQIAAYENLGEAATDATRAKLAQLKAERQEKQEEIDDQLQERVFELTSEGLDNLENALQDAFDDSIKDISSDLSKIKDLISTANGLTDSKFSAISKAFNELLKYYGINPVSTGVTSGTGFATGGIVRDSRGSVQANGDSTIVRVNPGETILTQKFTKLLPDAVDVMSGFVNNINSIPNITPIQTEATVNNDYSVTVQGNVDAETWPGLQKTIEAAYKYSCQQTMKNAKAVGVKKKFG